MKIASLLSLLFFLLLSVQAQALSDQEKEIQSINKMSLAELTAKAKAALEKKYPGEKWETYHFPKYVHISDAVLTSYKIAAKQPQLLAKFPCYCFCEETMNHRNLAHCYLKTGTFLGNFDDHGSSCSICNGEAMMGFLWNELGISTPEMQVAMKKIFTPR